MSSWFNLSKRSKNHLTPTSKFNHFPYHEIDSSVTSKFHVYVGIVFSTAQEILRTQRRDSEHQAQDYWTVISDLVSDLRASILPNLTQTKFIHIKRTMRCECYGRPLEHSQEEENNMQDRMLDLQVSMIGLITVVGAYRRQSQEGEV